MLDKNNPLVSVLMPAYNHEVFIEDAVRSVWNQSYKNIDNLYLFWNTDLRN